MRNRISSGRAISYVPQEDVSGGELVVFPGFVAVAATDICKGELGALETEGVFDLPKASGAISQGGALYLDSDKKLAASGETFVGVAWEGAAANSQFVACRINFGSAPAGAEE